MKPAGAVNVVRSYNEEWLVLAATSCECCKWLFMYYTVYAKLIVSWVASECLCTVVVYIL